MRIKKSYLITIIVLMAISLGSAFYQYVNIMKTEDVSAVSVGTPNPGHTWSSMECSADSLCVDTTSNRLGIGTNTPSQKLEVNGNIKLGGASPSYTVSNVISPVNTSDVATKEYVDAAGGTQTYTMCYVQKGGSACASGFTMLNHHTSSGWVADNAMGTTSASGFVFGVGGSAMGIALCDVCVNGSCYSQATDCSAGRPAAVYINGMTVIGPDCNASSFFAVCCK